MEKKAYDQRCMNSCYFSDQDGHADLIVSAMRIDSCGCCGKEESTFAYGCSTNQDELGLCKECEDKYKKGEMLTMILYSASCLLGGVVGVCIVFPLTLCVGKTKKVKFITKDAAKDLISFDPSATQQADQNGITTIILNNNIMQLMQR